MSCLYFVVYFFFSSRRRHTRCALVTGVQTCALPISVTLVVPTVWKKQFGLQASKEAAVIRASELFPRNAGDFRGPRGGIKDGEIGRASCRERECQYV